MHDQLGKKEINSYSKNRCNTVFVEPNAQRFIFKLVIQLYSYDETVAGTYKHVVEELQSHDALYQTSFGPSLHQKTVSLYMNLQLLFFQNSLYLDAIHQPTAVL